MTGNFISHRQNDRHLIPPSGWDTFIIGYNYSKPSDEHFHDIHGRINVI